MSKRTVTILGNPRWDDWHITLHEPVTDYWTKYGGIKTGEQMVPAEVGEVLCYAGVATPRIVGAERCSQYWGGLPWVAQ